MIYVWDRSTAKVSLCCSYMFRLTLMRIIYFAIIKTLTFQSVLGALSHNTANTWLLSFDQKHGQEFSSPQCNNKRLIFIDQFTSRWLLAIQLLRTLLIRNRKNSEEHCSSTFEKWREFSDRKKNLRRVFCFSYLGFMMESWIMVEFLPLHDRFQRLHHKELPRCFLRLRRTGLQTQRSRLGNSALKLQMLRRSPSFFSSLYSHWVPMLLDSFVFQRSPG